MRVLVLLLCFAAPAAFAQDSRGLLYFSAEHADGSDYGGAGWMFARRGLDREGPVAMVEIGRTLSVGNRVSAMGGWRLMRGRAVATGLVGIDVGEETEPTASVDIWWDDRGWMATFRGEVTGDESAWRSSAGRRPAEGWPWLGAELGENWDGLRIGVHATGVRLVHGFEARVSLGGSDRGSYAELSLWRRF